MILIQSKRETATFQIEDIEVFKKKAFAWASRFEVFCYLDSAQNPLNRFNSYEVLIGVGQESQLFKNTDNAFESLKAYFEKNKDWLFGFLSYDLKNDIEKLSSQNFDGLGFPEMHFFQPKQVIEIAADTVVIHATGNPAQSVFSAIQNIELKSSKSSKKIETIKHRLTKEAYLKTVETIRQHIIEGDVYEMNFCQEFYAEKAIVNPYALFAELHELAKAPFSCFYKLNDRFLLCASPERYLKKSGNTLISQPIKGTIRRGKDKVEDAALKKQLRQSEKDQAENVMIVDLVRNDLARICEPGSVKVEELFGVYPFRQVFQMISTVSGELINEKHFTDALKNTFPMGSMTGAPKVMAMELIEKYEHSKRGLYSGAVGYITPDGDFDFNVVIRSLLYNEPRQYLSFQVGGAIVYDSVPEEEYEECLLKAKAIFEILGQALSAK